MDGPPYTCTLSEMGTYRESVRRAQFSPFLKKYRNCVDDGCYARGVVKSKKNKGVCTHVSRVAVGLVRQIGAGVTYVRDLSCLKLIAIDLEKVAEAIGHSSTIRTLDLSHQFLLQTAVQKDVQDDSIEYESQTGLNALAIALSTNKSMQVLDMSNADVHNWDLLGYALTHNTTLEKLNLSNNPLSPQIFLGDVQLHVTDIAVSHMNTGAIVNLLVLLCSNTTVHTLDISNNYSGSIVPVLPGALIRLLEQNATLTDIRANQCDISDDDVSALASVLREKQTLKHLEIRENEYDVKGMTALFEMLEINTGLTELRVSVKQYPPDTPEPEQCTSVGNCLGQALKKNTTLRTLVTSLWGSAHEAIPEICTGIAENTGLIRLELDHCYRLCTKAAKPVRNALENALFRNTTLLELSVFTFLSVDDYQTLDFYISQNKLAVEKTKELAQKAMGFIYCWEQLRERWSTALPLPILQVVALMVRNSYVVARLRRTPDTLSLDAPTPTDWVVSKRARHS